jgi:hypothetical protein
MARQAHSQLDDNLNRSLRFQSVREDGRELAAEQQGTQPSIEPEGSAATIAHPARA